MKKKWLYGLTCGVMMLDVARMAQATPVQWVTNGHYYEAVSFNGTWDEANAFAQALTYNGMTGHLATLTSADESSYVWNSFATNLYFLGGYQTNKAAEPVGHWAWVTGETWDYTNWYPYQTGIGMGEPNNADGDEDHLQWNYYDGYWNDWHNGVNQPGFIVEYDASVPEPATMLLMGTGLAGLAGAGKKKKSGRRYRLKTA